MTDHTTNPMVTSIGSRPARPYDAIVIGARVAGAATAMLLARRGLRVLLLDKRRPGSDTLSTHALMRGGVLQLHRWGLLDHVIAAGTPPISRTTIHYGDTVDTIPIKPKGGVPCLFAPRRTVLDTILVEAAEEAGVDVRFGVSVDGLLQDETGRVRGVKGRTRGGERFTVAAPITIGADGRHSVVARAAGATVERQGTGSSATLYSYWSGMEVDGYEWFYRPGVSAGLIPTNGHQVCAWVGTAAEHLPPEMMRAPQAVFDRLFAEAAPEAVDRLSSARRHGKLFVFPGEAGYQRRPWGDGWALVGDASHFKDPLSTHGITDALRDAEFLCQAVVDVRTGRASEAQAMATYHATRNHLSDDLFTVVDVLAGYRWELSEMRTLLMALAEAMKDEVEALQGLDAHLVRAVA